MTTTLMALPSSNSSERLRNQLKTNYVKLPKILDDKPMRDYIQYALKTYNDGDSFYQKDDIMNAYIAYQCFFTFVFQKLRSHVSYSDKAYLKDIIDIKQKMNISMDRLEMIVKRLDDYEDQKLLDSLDDDDDDEDDYIFVNDDTINNQNMDGRDSRSIRYSYNTNDHNANTNDAVTVSTASLPQKCNNNSNNDTANDSMNNLITAFELLKPETGITTASVVSTSTTAAKSSITYSNNNTSNNGYDDTNMPYDIHIDIANSNNYSNHYDIHNTDITATEMDRFLGVTVMDVEIVRYLHHSQSIYTFPIPPPLLKSIVLYLPSIPVYNIHNNNHQPPQKQVNSSTPVYFHRDDFSVTFLPFFNHEQYSLLPVELQSTKSAIESNRCFFLHLGIAMNIHPFVLQIVFRHLAAVKKYQIRTKNTKGQNRLNNNNNTNSMNINNSHNNNATTNTTTANITSTSAMNTTSNDDDDNDDDYVILDILSSLELYAGFVDANCLLFLWPQEFNTSRICIVSGSDAAPMFSCYYAKGADTSKLRDVIIHCDGSHFTLLRPVIHNNHHHHQQQQTTTTSFQILSQLLHDATSAGLTVINNEIDCNNSQYSKQSSIASIINNLINHSN